ncbi:hypothetical protein CYMTET_48308 [Cymbomonas tetramitiformis]|uniref:GT23 domain-containing protein n=1 Tax=Cymbomonas tetramitiformis TaxID=36881 RepID=A0AAE0BSJ1_9CHLO|nr:hypothetical protein CYMTET_48308 [Cymbomonas tetramitiformis]
MPWLEEEIRSAKAKVGGFADGELMIGMHIRHGDSCLKTKKSGKICHGIEEYMRAANEMQQLYQVSHIYLATDNPDIAQMLSKHAYKWRNFTWHMLELDDGVQGRLETSSLGLGAKRLDSKDCPKNSSGCVDMTGAASLSIIEVSLLASTDFFIGTFSSNMGRTAYEMMSVEKGYRPYVTLDFAWCGHWGISKPVYLAYNPKKKLRRKC